MLLLMPNVFSNYCFFFRSDWSEENSVYFLFFSRFSRLWVWRFWSIRLFAENMNFGKTISCMMGTPWHHKNLKPNHNTIKTALYWLVQVYLFCQTSHLQFKSTVWQPQNVSYIVDIKDPYFFHTNNDWRGSVWEDVKGNNG